MAQWFPYFRLDPSQSVSFTPYFFSSHLLLKNEGYSKDLSPGWEKLWSCFVLWVFNEANGGHAVVSLLPSLAELNQNQLKSNWWGKIPS